MKSDSITPGLFRTEALEHHFRDDEGRGVLNASPPWTWVMLLLCATLIVATGVYVAVAEIEIIDRVEGLAQYADARKTSQVATERLVITAYLAAKNAAFVHAGDRVRVELRDYPRSEFGFIDGRVVRIVPQPVPSKECICERAAPPASLRMEVAITPLAGMHLRAGMPASVQMVLRKQRLIAYVLDPLQR